MLSHTQIKAIFLAFWLLDCTSSGIHWQGSWKLGETFPCDLMNCFALIWHLQLTGWNCLYFAIFFMLVLLYYVLPTHPALSCSGSRWQLVFTMSDLTTRSDCLSEPWTDVYSDMCYSIGCLSLSVECGVQVPFLLLCFAVFQMNLASQSVLEGLNACLDHRGEVFVPELARTFHIQHDRTRIFACQNPLNQGGGRKGLPRSFLNRFTQVFVCGCAFKTGFMFPL